MSLEITAREYERLLWHRGITLNRVVRLALIRRNLTLEIIGKKIGRSKGLVSLILSEKHMGWALRPQIKNILGLPAKAIWPKTWKGEPKKRRAAA